MRTKTEVHSLSYSLFVCFLRFFGTVFIPTHNLPILAACSPAKPTLVPLCIALWENSVHQQPQINCI